MTKKMKLFSSILFFLCLISFSQNQKNKYELIQKIKDLSNWSEIVFGSKFNHSYEIHYNEESSQIKIINLNDYGGNEFDLNELTFYLDDIDKNSFEYSINKISNGFYVPFVEITTYNKSVERKKTTWKKGKKHLAITQKEYLNKIRLFANMNEVSKYLAEKYVDYCYQLTECNTKTLRK